MLAVLLVVTRHRPTTAALRGGLVFGFTLTGVFTLETFGIAQTSATNAGVIISLTMVMTPIAESLWTKSPLSRRHLGAGAVAFFGVVLLSTGGDYATPRSGDWLVLGAAALRAVHVCLMRRNTVAQEADDLSLTFVQITTGAVVFTAMGFLLGQGPVSFLATMDTHMWLQMGYLTAICTLFPFYTQMWSVRRTSASHVALLLGTEPIYAAIVGVLFAGDHLGLTGGLGMIIVLATVMWNQVVTTRSLGTPCASSELAVSGSADAVGRGQRSE